MVKCRLKKRIAAALTLACLSVQSIIAPIGDAFVLTTQAASWTGIVKADLMNVRSGPGTDYSIIGSLYNNSQVTVTDQTTGTDGYVWYQISYGNGQSGYARSDYITQETIYSASDSNFEAWLTSQGFPESYKNALRGLHEKYPNWVFTAQHTGLDWDTVIEEESIVGRNLVASTSISSWKSTADGAFDWAANSWPGFDGSAWNAASSDIIAHYMDPRNFLDETYIFQFELQSYNSATQTRDGLMELLEGTFLDNEVVVPVNGSSVSAGTLIENDGYGYAGKTYGYSGDGSSSSDTSDSSTVITSGSEYGPGTGTTSGQSQSSYSGGYVNSGPGVSISDAGETESLSIFSIISDGLFKFTGGIKAYADGWEKLSDDPLQWVYEQSDGTMLSGGWYWLDGNNDGIAECYYFYENGIMAYNTIIDGYMVNADGKWVDGSGNIYTKNTDETTSIEETSSSVESVNGPGAQTGTDSTQSSDGSGATDTAETEETAQAEAKYSEQMKLVHYADIIMEAASQSGVSPYVIASMILQEQGSGTSDSISGTNSTYPGVYNYFNLGAYEHDGMGAIEAGLYYASQSGTGDRPWTNIEKSIIGGAILYGQNYVSAGQDTFYLKKFNVQGSNLYQHQYMTNVPAAASEGAKVAEAYNDEIKATALVFKIPVYENMPDEKCPMPTVDGNPNNKLSSISVDGYTITPTFSMDTNDYSLIVDNAVTSVYVSASAIDSNAVVSGKGTVNLNVGVNTLTITVTAENGTTRDYRLSITRREGALGDETSSESTVVTGDTVTDTASETSTVVASTEAGYVDSGPGAVQTTTTAETTTSSEGPGSQSVVEVEVGMTPPGS